MAIDPRISLGVQTPNIDIKAPDPWLRVQRMMTLRDMMQRRELQAEQTRALVEERELKAQQLREQMEAAQRLQGVLGRYAAQPPTGPPEAPVSEAMEAGALQGYAPELLAPLANRPPREGEAAPGMPRYPSYGEVFEAGGVKYGIPAWEAIQKAQKEERLAENARLEQEGKDAIERGNIAQGIISGGDSESYTQGILELLRRGKISQERAGQFLSHKWYSPETRSALKIMVAAGNKAYDQTEEARKQRKADLEEPGVVAATSEKVTTALQQGLKTAAQTIDSVPMGDNDAFQEWLAGQEEPVRRLYAGLPWNARTRTLIERSGMTAKERTELAISGVGKITPPPRDVQEYELRKIEAGAEARARNVVSKYGDEPDLIAQAIIDGDQPPVLTGLYGASPLVRAELARKGFNLSAASRDWDAIKRHMATLNGPQQERLRQAIGFTYDSLGQIDELYSEWVKLAPQSGFKALNRLELKAAMQLPGRVGAVASNLNAAINDLTSELGTVYKGGNASTDESLRLAAENLKSDWNKQTYDMAMKRIRESLLIRKNSILNSQPMGVTPGSPYLPATPGATPPAGGGQRKSLDQIFK